ncbi:MmgE/PrpD family protein [Celeribacter naphthalenivorans]|uniref:MmgE/PrpD family protein n=1 Tax=Celeribacter naphthalenivorans TaxID=1614694 RepID=UPI001CFC44AE|nr:MmgE/PrpD family protein [Celeribacter naphthalenivorans]
MTSPDLSPDLSHEFAAYIAACTYDDLTPDAVDRAKKSIFDLLGCILAAGGTVPAISGVMEMARENGGEPTCSVLGYGDRLPPLMAAFANGSMAHCLDFDDVAPDGNHASSSLIPAVFAAAEHKGGVSGKRIITAVAIGQDIFLRLRRSLNAQRLDWLTTTVLGIFSATAGVSYVLGLDAKQTANALGIAALSSCGTLEIRFGTGSDLGEFYAGFLAKNAVLSATLAQKGVTGLQRVFEGQAGIMNVYFNGDYSRERALAGLGKEFKGGEMQYKPYPVCGIANTYIYATLELLREHNIAAEDIVELRAFVGDFQQRMSKPLDERRAPQMAMDARFSMPFCLAVAAAHGAVKVEHFTEEGLRDPKTLDMAQRVLPVDDSAFDWTGEMPEAKIEIDLKSGKTVVGTSAGQTPGTRANPMGWPELIEKFRDCAQFAAKPVAAEAIERVIALSQALESLDDGTEITRLLT